MHVHNVLFWLKSGATAEDRAALEAGFALLMKDPAIGSAYCGVPADTHRDVVDRSYDYGLTLVFGDLAGHDAYQVGPVHQKFVGDHKDKWQRVQVVDIET